MSSIRIVEIATAGPQGPAGQPGASGKTDLSELNDVNVIGKVDKSVLAYDATSSKWVGSDANTVVTLTDGGNW